MTEEFDFDFSEKPIDRLWSAKSREAIDEICEGNSQLLAEKHGALGKTFPHHLASHGMFDLMMYCVESKGYDPNALDVSGRNLLFSVVSSSFSGALGAAKSLIEQFGADVNAVDEFGDTPLHHAAQNQNASQAVEIATLLLAHGARIDATSKDGRNPFLVALSFGGAGFPLARFLAEKDPQSVRVRDNSGNDALLRACEGGGKRDALEWLLELQEEQEGGKKTLFSSSDQALRKIFGFGADDSSVANAELLISKGAKATVGEDGNTLLHLACGFGVQSLKLAKLAVETLNVDPKAINAQGRTALHQSCDFSTGDAKIVRYLLGQDGIDVNARDGENKTALLLAVENAETLKNCEETIHELIKSGANINEAIALAEQKSSELVDLLKGNSVPKESNNDSNDEDEEDWGHGFSFDSSSDSDSDQDEKAAKFNFDWD